MSLGIASIDHPVIAVKSLQDSHGVYTKLGFTIPPRGAHLEWGTGNWCIMFPHDYLELRGIIDPAKYTHNLDRFLALREGLMGVAFNAPGGAQQVYDKAIQAGLNPNPPRELTRNFELPQGSVQPRFRLTFFDAAHLPSLMGSLVCEHLTPELLRGQDQWLSHANTACGIVSMTSVAADPGAEAQGLRKLLGDENVADCQGGITGKLPNGSRLKILGAAQAEADGESIPGVDLPYLSTIAIQVKNLDNTEQVLRANNVPHERTSEGIRVGHAQACGTILKFIA